MSVLHEDCRCEMVPVTPQALVDADHHSLTVPDAKPGRQGLLSCNHILRKMLKIFPILSGMKK